METFLKTNSTLGSRLLISFCSGVTTIISFYLYFMSSENLVNGLASNYLLGKHIPIAVPFIR